MVKRKRISEAEADLLAMKLRRENMVQMHKTAMEEFKFREMIKAGETIRNYQNEYGNLYNAHRRLPTGLQGAAAARKDVFFYLLEHVSRWHVKELCPSSARGIFLVLET